MKHASRVGLLGAMLAVVLASKPASAQVILGSWETNPLSASHVAPGQTTVRTAVRTFLTNFTGTFKWGFTSRAGTYSTVTYSSSSILTTSLIERPTTEVRTTAIFVGSFTSGTKLTVTTYAIANVGVQDIWNSVYLEEPFNGNAVAVPMTNWMGLIVLASLIGLSAIVALRRITVPQD